MPKPEKMPQGDYRPKENPPLRAGGVLNKSKQRERKILRYLNIDKHGAQQASIFDFAETGVVVD